MATATVDVKTAVPVVESKSSAVAYLASDAKLVERKAEMSALHAKYSQPAPAAVFDRVAASLETKNKFVVHRADTKADALAACIRLLGDVEGTSFASGGVQSLEDIGFVAWAASAGATKFKNFNALAHANYGKPEYGMYKAQGAIADVFFTTPSALSETGDLVWASATAGRVSLYAKKTVFLVGSNKIVATEADGLRRLYEYCKPLVGARTRAMYGAPDTAVTETGILSQQNPFGPGQFHVIMCREPLGY